MYKSGVLGDLSPGKAIWIVNRCQVSDAITPLVIVCSLFLIFFFWSLGFSRPDGICYYNHPNECSGGQLGGSPILIYAMVFNDTGFFYVWGKTEPHVTVYLSSKREHLAPTWTSLYLYVHVGEYGDLKLKMLKLGSQKELYMSNLFVTITTWSSTQRKTKRSLFQPHFYGVYRVLLFVIKWEASTLPYPAGWHGIRWEYV